MCLAEFAFRLKFAEEILPGGVDRLDGFVHYSGRKAALEILEQIGTQRREFLGRHICLGDDKGMRLAHVENKV